MEVIKEFRTQRELGDHLYCNPYQHTSCKSFPNGQALIELIFTGTHGWFAFCLRFPIRSVYKIYEEGKSFLRRREYATVQLLKCTIFRTCSTGMRTNCLTLSTLCIPSFSV